MTEFPKQNVVYKKIRSQRHQVSNRVTLYNVMIDHRYRTMYVCIVQSDTFSSRVDPESKTEEIYRIRVLNEYK